MFTKLYGIKVCGQLGQNQVGQHNSARLLFPIFLAELPPYVGRVDQKIKNLFGQEFTPKTQEFNHAQYIESYNRGNHSGMNFVYPFRITVPLMLVN